MKGIMVTLLMFLTTGIVVGQQRDSSNNSFNSGSSSTQNDLLKPLEIGVSADAIRAIREGKVLVSKIEAVNPDTGETLHRNVINGVSLFQEGKNLNNLSKTPVRGTDSGDGVLRFGLTEAHLNALENNQLKMDFSANERGKYQEIEVFFVNQNRSTGVGQQTSRATASNGSGGAFSNSRPRMPTPDNTRPSTDHFGFGPRNNRANNNTNQTTYIPLPAPAEPGDVDFMGPTLPTRAAPTVGSWSPPNQQTQNNPAFDPNRRNEFANTQNDNRGAWSFPKQNDSGFQSVGRNQQDDRQGEFEAMQARWEAEKQRLDYENMVLRLEAEKAKREEEERQWAQAKLEQEYRNNQSRTPVMPTLNGPLDRPLATNPGLGSGTISNYDRQFDPRRNMTQEEFTYNSMMWELERKANQLQSQEASLNRKTNLLEFKVDQLDTTMRELARNNTQLGNQTLRTNMPQNANPNYDRSYQNEFGEHYYPPNNLTGPVIDRSQAPNNTRRNVGAPDNNGFRSPSSNDDKDITSRVVSTSNRKGIKDYATSIPGSSSKSTSNRDDRVNGFVLFLLLCSLGLNFYLAFISRGFYVRYHELADELRETFSTTH